MAFIVLFHILLSKIKKISSLLIKTAFHSREICIYLDNEYQYLSKIIQLLLQISSNSIINEKISCLFIL